MRFEAKLPFGAMTQRTDFRTSRQEAPEELVLPCTRAVSPPGRQSCVEGTQPKKGRGTSRSRKPSGQAEGNWGERLSRELNRTRNRVFGPPRWKATPELVSQDRGRVFELSGSLTRLRTPAYPSLGAVGPGSNAGPHFFVGRVSLLSTQSRHSPRSAGD
jgi:hypothetical protein